MNTEDKMYMGSDVIEGYEDMRESVPCCQRPSCVPREVECACTGEPSETDLPIADYQEQLSLYKEAMKLANRESNMWKLQTRAHSDMAYERLKVIRELERRLNESWWTKFCRWVKDEWEYDIYDHNHSR
jgi:hypothetical protein